MATLTVRDIYDAARTAGFSPQQAVTWTAIAMAESRGNLNALNSKGEYSVGLWQINIRSGVRQNVWGDLTKPENNARAAYEISNHGRDMRPWTTTHDHNKGTAADYRRYLPAIEQEIGVEGDGRGVHGYGAKLPPPLPEPSYDRIDAGRDLSAAAMPAGAGQPGTAALDSDVDGLTDTFERLVGSDGRRADTDRDGLDDGYEASVSRTDPLSGDTDGDHVGDRQELAAGTDAGRLPGVGGVVGTGLLAENARTAEDRDDDGLSDRTEKLIGTSGRVADTDADQLADAVEVSLGTDPTAADSDSDGVVDGWETRLGQDPLRGNGAAAALPVPRWTLEAAAAARQPAPANSVPSDPAAAAGAAGSSGALSTFLTAAQTQEGDPYVYGAQPSLSDRDPDSFDCSALTQWAARRAGVTLPRTAEEQYRLLKGEGMTVPVEQALKTPGALLFYFSSEPVGALPPGKAHVAISLGNGKVFEARGSSWGVGEWSAKGRGFNYAGVVPGLSEATTEDVATSAVPPAAAAPAVVAPASALPAGIAAAGATVGGATDPYAIGGGEPLTRERLRGAGAEDPDSDADGLTDAFEKLARTDADVADTDRDGLGDGYEATTSRTDPLAADTDRDGVRDADEVGAGTDAGRLPGMAHVTGSGRFAENTRHGVRDRDRDGLSDRTEKLLGTRRDRADSDGDEVPDATEVALGTDPLDTDSDHDGLSDWLEMRYPGTSAAPDGLGAGMGSGLPGGGAAGSPESPAAVDPAEVLDLA